MKEKIHSFYLSPQSLKIALLPYENHLFLMLYEVGEYS